MIWQQIAAVLGALILVALFVRTVVLPVGRFVRAAVRLADLHPQVVEVVDALGANGGESLFNRVEKIQSQMNNGEKYWENRVARIEQQITDLQRSVEIGILDRREGGRRRSDPHT